MAEKRYTDEEVTALERSCVAAERERCAAILDAEAHSWIERKAKLRAIEEVPEAHDRFANYIANAVRLALAIRNQA